jgi:hypothetical protein
VRTPAAATPRLLASFAAALVIALAGCGGSSSGANQSASAGAASAGASGGEALPTGLSANLDQLASYRFSESIPVASPGASASGGAGGPIVVSGTVVNRPVKAVAIEGPSAYFILVGNQMWTSVDGSTWMVGDPTDTILTDLLPGHDYGTWFDDKAGYFAAVGTEVKNGVQCTHYKGGSSLSGLYANTTGSPTTFQADVWIATNGDYPVSGMYGLVGTSGGQGGSWGFSFDITRADDPANAVAPPSNVVALPS